MMPLWDRSRSLLLCFALSLGAASLGAQVRLAETTRQGLTGSFIQVRVLVEDLNGDGMPDLLFFGTLFLAQLFINDGRGYFPESTFFLTPRQTLGAAALDFDHDGDLDLTLASGMYVENRLGRVMWLENDGSGQFSDVTPGRFFYMNAGALEAGDVNGDGLVDLVVAGIYRRHEVLLGQPSGGFAVLPEAFPEESLASSDLALVDVNGDDHLDAVVTTRAVGGFPDASYLYVNTGTGIFVPLNTLPRHLDNSNRVVAGDVDGDGDADLVIANRGAPIRLYLNRGNGFFDDGADRLPGIAQYERAWDLDLADLDRDGDLDLLSGALWSGYVARYWENTGGGYFVDRSAETLPKAHTQSFAIGVGDLDGDGDLDAVVGYSLAPFDQDAKVLMNLERQVFGDPQVFLVLQGTEYDVSLRGSPGHFVILGISTGISRMALPSLGTLWLDPAGSVLFPPVGLGVGGAAIVRVPVPADPSLYGRVFHFQGLEIDPVGISTPRLTNTFEVVVQ